MRPVKALDTIGIVGLGLIGASLALAVRRRLPETRLVGVDVDPGALALAQQRGAIDTGATTLEPVQEADLVVIAVPPDAVVEVARQAAAAMKPHSILTDVASTKSAIVDALERVLPRHVHYVGGHPMAGAEFRGPARADASLLVGRPFLLTPTARSDGTAVEILRGLVEQLGMRPVVLTPAAHDDLVAQVSHLPYLVAAAMVNTTSEAAMGIRGPAFSDLVRVAASPVALWVQICHMNRAAIQRVLQGFRRELDDLERTLGDRHALEPLLERSRQRAQAGRSNHAPGP